MRVLITRPEREATTLATALAERGHVPVIAPLFRLEILHPSADFATDLSACQAVLLSSATGARALASSKRSRLLPQSVPILPAHLFVARGPWHATPFHTATGGDLFLIAVLLVDPTGANAVDVRRSSPHTAGHHCPQ